MLGDSFCKLFHKSRLRSVEKQTFNPHAWGLFLQVKAGLFKIPNKLGLSIPMLGDSFCKSVGSVENDLSGIAFQSPCLGTLFASLNVT